MRCILLLTIAITINAFCANAQNLNRLWYSIDSAMLSHQGETYRPFSLTTQDGKVFTNESCLGKVIVFDFWFESCSGCVMEFEELNTAYKELKYDTSVVFVAVTFDKQEGLNDYIIKHGLEYPIATTGSQIEFRRLDYGMGSPSKIIINKQGKISKIGYRIKPSEIPGLVRSLL